MKPSLPAGCSLNAIRTLITVLCVFLSLTGCSSDSATNRIEGFKHVASYDQGYLYEAGKIKVLQLNGNWQQMGRQYGALMSVEIQKMYDEVKKQYLYYGVAGSEDELTGFSENLFGLYPERFQQMAKGMLATSGISAKKLATVNEFFDFLLSRMPAACSMMAAWGAHTKDGSLVMGRNFDFQKFYKPFAPYLLVVIYNPDDGSLPTAVITYAGQMGALQAFNSAGLVLENNDGSNSGDKNRYFGSRTPFMIKDLELLLDHSSLESLESAFLSYRPHYPLIFNFASSQKASTYETTTSEIKKRDGNDGLLVATNHFVHQAWALPPDNYGYIAESKERHANLINQAAQNKGNIDAEKMMQIFDLTKAQGGATPEGICIYQFVAVPEKLKIWVKAPSFMDWTEINLGKFFDRTFSKFETDRVSR